MNIKWNQADKQFVKDNAWNFKDKDLATALSERKQRSVSIDAVRKLRQRMGIFKKSGRGRCELKEL